MSTHIEDRERPAHIIIGNPSRTPRVLLMASWAVLVCGCQTSPAAESSAQTDSPLTAGDWIDCADEGARCIFTGTTQVRYGATGSFAYKELTGGTACTNDVFGDPIPGTFKRCAILSSPPVWTHCAAENERCNVSGDAVVRYGAKGVYAMRNVTNGVGCNNATFGDPIPGVLKSCDVASTFATPATPAPPPPPAGPPSTTPPPTPPAPPSGGPTFSQAAYEAAISFDFEGENGRVQQDSSRPSVGYPCGVPNNYSWKFGGGGVTDVRAASGGRGPQLAGAGYDQIYNACSGATPRRQVSNARIELTDLVVDYYSISHSRWVRVIKQSARGAAFAEDFVNNEATGADSITLADGHMAVRSGIGNAGPLGAGGAGGPVPSGRTVQDSAVGYNFHGFGDRFDLDWSDARAVIVAQAMRCVPNQGSDASDCEKLGYIANVGLDSWHTKGSDFDGFRTHGGVSGGMFKAVTTSWQVFTNYSGPRGFAGLGAPPAPQF